MALLGRGRRPRTIEGRAEHVVVVGAGLSGLATAMHLAGAGRRVTVVERGPGPGGRAGRLTLPDGAAPGEGYRFDTGPTVLTLPELIADCFDALGEDLADWLDLRPVEPLYRARFADGSGLDVLAGTEAMAEHLAEVIGPQEAENFRSYVAFLRRLYRYEMRDFIDRNLDSPLDLVTANLARIVALGGLRRLAPTVARYLADDRTRRVFSFQALYAGVSPQQALAIYAVISYMDTVAGVSFPRGGMHALPSAMAAAAGRHGVGFRFGTEVVRVDRSARRAHGVITADGERIPADAVVLTPDLPVAYGDLLGETPRRVRRLRWSPSCFLLLAGSRADHRERAHHTILFGTAWREVFEDLARGRLMRDPSLLVSRPTVTDPGLAPRGRHSYYVLAPTPHLRAGDRPLDWARLRSTYRDHVVATLEARGYADFGSSLEVEHVTTPQDWADLGLAAGTPFAAAHTFGQTGPFRPGNLWGENVVLAGSGTRPGVGVPMVIVSGRLAAERITGRDPAYRSRAWP